MVTYLLTVFKSMSLGILLSWDAGWYIQLTAELILNMPKSELTFLLIRRSHPITQIKCLQAIVYFTLFLTFLTLLLNPVTGQFYLLKIKMCIFYFLFIYTTALVKALIISFWEYCHNFFLSNISFSPQYILYTLPVLIVNNMKIQTCFSHIKFL